MIVAMDASVLTFVLRPEAAGPAGVDRLADRVRHLISELTKANATVVIPTPALAEVLVQAGAAGPALLSNLERGRVFRVAPFDQIAAVEHAALVEQRLSTNTKLSRTERAKAKFDEQIVAIATVTRAEIIYSDDADIRKLVVGGRKVLGLADLPLPPQDAQGNLF